MVVTSIEVPWFFYLSFSLELICGQALARNRMEGQARGQGIVKMVRRPGLSSGLGEFPYRILNPGSADYLNIK
jgi:hypothetical protein